MKGRIAVLKEYGKPLELDEYEVPRPEPGAILVRVSQASICGSDLHMWRQDSKLHPLPSSGRAMGHEGTGVIESLGTSPMVDALGRPLAEGDRIIHSVVAPCHSCWSCLRGEENLCLNKVVTPPAGVPPYFVGTFADFYYVPPGVPVFKVPGDLSDDLLSPVNCAMGTVAQALISAGVGQGQTVVVQGAGGLGLTACAMARDMGAHRVIIVDRLDNRLELAKRFGADFTINVGQHPDSADRVTLVRDLTEGRGADAVFEFVGSAALVTEGVAMLRVGGTYVDVGLWFSGQTIQFDPSTVVMTGKRIMGSAMYRPGILPMVMDFLQRVQGVRPFGELVSHRFDLEEINLAFDQSEWDQQNTPVVRAVIVP